MPTEAEVRSAYDHCRRITRSRAANFYYAFRTLPAARRRAIYATYAFCRLCDDIADGTASPDEKRQEFDRVKRALGQGDDGATADPVFTALRHATTAFDIPLSYLEIDLFNFLHRLGVPAYQYPGRFFHVAVYQASESARHRGAE